MSNNSEIKNLIRLGFDCNVDCKFCNFVKSNEPDYTDFSQAAIKKQIDQLALNNVNYLSFSGGEPLLRNDLAEIISYAKSQGIKDIDIQTNAILLDVQKIKLLKKSGLNIAFVSFHTHLPLLYEKLLNSKNIFEKIVGNIKLLLAAEIEVVLNPVVNQLTYRYLPDFARFIIQEFPGVKSISLSIIQPHGKALQYQKLLPDYTELAPYIKKFLEYINVKSKMHVINPYCGLPFCLAAWYNDLEKNVEYVENKEKYKIDKNKMYLDNCNRCRFKYLCNGVWKEYVKIFGEEKTNSMLNPIIDE